VALDATALAEAIHSKVEAARPEIVALFQSGDTGTALASAIVEHLTANAEVRPDGSPAMAAGGDAVTGKGRIT
jgi:hypothetical protein